MPVSNPPSQDIPPARRESTEVSLAEIENIALVPASQGRGLRLIIFAVLLASLVGAAYWQRGRLVGVKAAIAQADFDFLSGDRTDTDSATGSASARNAAVAETGDTAAASDAAQSSIKTSAEAITEASTAVSDNPATVGTGDADELLNHRRYDVADVDSLVALNADSSIRLRPDAQSAIAEMIAAAKADGVQLGLVSGFRTLEDQDYLYFDLKAERGESAQSRAEVSAPPGYSEHHTGYAVDFIDESAPDTFLEESFETTDAFAWLEANAAFFNFEMSFPKDNAANLSYEPWHWRYVGNQESLELFYK